MNRKNTTGKTGLLMIPDLSGFSDFVMRFDIDKGSFITKKLLEAIIRCNYLGFEISEIEGDAVLFYKFRKLPSFEEILKQIEAMFHKFMEELSRLERQYGLKIPLSLKIIVHSGIFTNYQVGKFEKLYGTPVVEVHQLLKNKIAKFPPYALYSDAFLKTYRELPAMSSIDYSLHDDCTYISGTGYVQYL